MKGIDSFLSRLNYYQRKRVKAVLFIIFALLLWFSTYLVVSYVIRWAVLSVNVDRQNHKTILSQWNQRQEMEQKPIQFDWTRESLEAFQSNYHVLWMAPFWSRSGYGTEAIAFVLGLNERLPSRTLVWQYGDRTSPEAVALPISRKLEALRARTPQFWETALVSVCHCTPYAWAPLRVFRVCPPRNGVVRIARTMFETNSLPTSWIPKLNAMDKIWVPTKFHVETFKNAGVNASKLVAVPEPVDSTTFDPNGTYDKFKLPRDFADASFVFLSIFKWEARKGWKYLVKAFYEEFKNSPDIKLFILSKGVSEKANPYRDLNKLLGTSEHPGIHLSDEHLKPSQLPGIYKAVNAFVLPSNGEGWGRPVVEAMCMELPVIATNWSGPTEFMTEENSYPLQIEDELGPVDIDSMGGEEVRHHKWAIPSVQHLRSLMRHIVTHPEEAARKGKQARKDMIEKYNIDAVSQIVATKIKEAVDTFVNSKLSTFAPPREEQAEENDH